MTLQFRPMTIQEKTGAVSAYGGRTMCDEDCTNVADYVVNFHGVTYYVCGWHKYKFEREVDGRAHEEEK